MIQLATEYYFCRESLTLVRQVLFASGLYLNRFNTSSTNYTSKQLFMKD